MDHYLEQILNNFNIPKSLKLTSINNIEIGHINSTYFIDYNSSSSDITPTTTTNNNITRYVLQKINTNIFKDPIGLINNMIIVCNHLKSKLIPTLTLISVKKEENEEDKYYYIHNDNTFWRLCYYINNSKVINDIPSLNEIFTTSQAFGNFQYYLSDLEPSILTVTIPNFHNTRLRYNTFMQTVQNDPLNRIKEFSLENDIQFIIENENRLVDAIQNLHDIHQVPYRIVHNDTKLNNILLDKDTNEAICVIDLDTVMIGSLLYDFGDMVRSACSTAVEDERDLNLVTIDLTKFEKLVEGYLSSNIYNSKMSNESLILSNIELDYLSLSGQIVTYEQGIRFLNDFLLGDVYYSTNPNREGKHNLERSRNQLKLLSEMKRNEREMSEIVNRFR